MSGRASTRTLVCIAAATCAAAGGAGRIAAVARGRRRVSIRQRAGGRHFCARRLLRVNAPTEPPLTFCDQSRWFAEEVLPHEPPLRSYLRQSLPSLADVDDLVQDCFARMLRAKTTGTVRSPKPLLFAIARNAVRDFIARKGRAELVPITENAECAVLVEENDVVETVCRNQELALLTEAIHALPERCREVLLLRKIKGYSQKEIAALLGIAEHTVEALAAKGTRRCADYLQARGLEARR
jgi:RNA polymerase sigma factor (sigma-70 family)